MAHPFDVVIGLDRSDKKADLHLIDTGSGHARSQTIATAPEALHDWLAGLRQQSPTARVAKESILHSRWAAAHYQQQRDKGSGHHAAVRSLAFKWQRVIWKCWQTRTPYNEARYEAALRKTNSPLVALLDQIEVGKSPVKSPRKKLQKPLVGLPQR